jgi:hypothetical protein
MLGFSCGGFACVNAYLHQYQLLRARSALEARLESEKAIAIQLEAEQGGLFSPREIETYCRETLHMVRVENHQVRLVRRTARDGLLPPYAAAKAP